MLYIPTITIICLDSSKMIVYGLVFTTSVANMQRTLYPKSGLPVPVFSFNSWSWNWGNCGRFTIFNLVVCEGKFRAFAGDQQLPIQCEDHWRVVQVNHTSNHISWLPGASKIPTPLMPTLALGNKTPGLREMEVQEALIQLQKWSHEDFLLTSGGIWFLQGTHLSTKDNSQGGVYLADEWNRDA